MQTQLRAVILTVRSDATSQDPVLSFYIHINTLILFIVSRESDRGSQ